MPIHKIQRSELEGDTGDFVMRKLSAKNRAFLMAVVKTSPSHHTVITANDGSSSFQWKRLSPYRGLLWSLVLRDWKVRYGQTRLGLFWIVLQPLLSAGLLALVFGLIVKRAIPGVPYPLFVLSGWMCWSFFSSATLQSAQLVVQYQAVMRKVYFPKSILPLSKLIGLMPEFLVGLFLALLYSIAVGSLSWRILFLPVAIGFLWLAVAGIVVLATALGGSYRDVQQLLPYSFQMLFFLSPVAYPFGLFGDYLPGDVQWMLYLNPIAGCIDLFRYLLFNTWQISPHIVWSLVSSLFFLLIGLSRFGKEERKWTEGL